jgi:hypothetical protein
VLQLCLFSWIQFDRDLLGKGASHRFLEGQNIARLDLVALGLQMFVDGSPDQMRGDWNPVA